MNSRGTWNGPSFVQRWIAKGPLSNTYRGSPCRRPRTSSSPTCRPIQRRISSVDGSVTGADRRGADQGTRTKRELIYVTKGARRRTNHRQGVRVTVAWCTSLAVAAALQCFRYTRECPDRNAQLWLGFASRRLPDSVQRLEESSLIKGSPPLENGVGGTAEPLGDDR